MQNNQNGQQQLFMSPQTENLQQMYSLINRLMHQLKENKTQKAKILHRIDILSEKLNRDPEKRKEGYQNDIVVFEQFLEREDNIDDQKKSSNDNKKEDLETIDSDTIEFQKLLQQNKSLKKLLDRNNTTTFENFQKLRLYEESFQTVVTVLREDVINYRKAILKKIGDHYNNELLVEEEAEFTVYLENVQNLAELFDICELFKTLLNLLGG